MEEPSVYFLEVYERLCKNRPFNYGDNCTGTVPILVVWTFCVYTNGFVEPSLYVLYVFERIYRSPPYKYRDSCDGTVRIVAVCIRICIGTDLYWDVFVVAVSYIMVTAVVALLDT